MTSINNKFIVKMATTGVGFRWLDILEKEFDKACVELDTSLSDLETEDPEVVFSARQKIATLSSCFAQLTHKALTIFQNSAKLEAELVDMRAELVQARAAGGWQGGGDAGGCAAEAARARAEAAQMARENAALRETVLALHSELFGARLATKYLDKELAGRIQQLQLLGRDMRAELRDSLWAQVEAEILLQRHKTLVRVCRGLAPRAPRPPAASRAPPAPRTVRVRRSPHLGLGISVTGGREHGVPILISELEAGGPAALTGQLYVGDAILAINDLDLTQACHKEAVQALQSVKGDCALCVQFIATDDDDRLSEDNYRFPLYPEDGDVFEEEPDGSGATPTAPRTPEFNHRRSDSEDSRGHGERGEGEGARVGDGLRVGEVLRVGDGLRVGEGARVGEGLLGVGGMGVMGGSGVLGGLGSVGGTHYADYNSANNLAILDMDDDSIKIEARLEMAPVSAVAGASLGSSPRSTPVHTRTALKKKRKPQDWRTKGAYCAVSDAQSSDEPGAPDTPGTPDTPETPHVTDRCNDNCHIVTPRNYQPPISEYIPLPVPSPAPEAPAYNSTGVCDVTPTPLTSAVTSATSVTSKPPAPDLQTARDSYASPLDVRFKANKTNGDSRQRRETKGFRIGSARRVTESGVRNGEVEHRPPAAPAPHAPPVAAPCAPPAPPPKLPAAPRLLSGRGDPDFGTPV